VPPTIRFAENLADDAGVESDDSAWCPPTVSLPLYVATYGRHAAPFAGTDAQATAPVERGPEASLGEPARTGRWQGLRGAAARLGGWAMGRTA
jgi:hypothetical protein